jgi:hypothetical protein
MQMQMQGMGQFQQQQPQGGMKLNKSSRNGVMNHNRFSNHQNECLHLFRRSCLTKIVNGEDVDLSAEIDFDLMDCQNYRFRPQEPVVICMDRFVPHYEQMKVLQEISEICQFTYTLDDGSPSSRWVMGHQGKVYPVHVTQDTYRQKEMAAISEKVRERLQRERQEAERQRLERQR